MSLLNLPFLKLGKTFSSCLSVLFLSISIISSLSLDAQNLTLTHKSDVTADRITSIHSHDGNTVYAATFSGSEGIFKSTDGGDTWNKVNTGITQLELQGVFALDENNVYATSEKGLIYHSPNGGANWNVIGDAPGAVDAALGIHAVNLNTIYVGTVFGVMKTTDAGMTWTVTKVEPGFINLVYRVVALDENTVFITTLNGVHKTTDGGLTWTEIYSFPGTTITEIVVIDENNLVLPVGNQIFKSTNGGTNWSLVYTGLQFSSFYSIHSPDNINLFTIGSGNPSAPELAISRDGGDNWETFEGDLSIDGGEIFALSENRLLVGGYDTASDTRGLFCATLSNEVVPTLGEWTILILSLLLVIVGVVSIRHRSLSPI